MSVVPQKTLGWLHSVLINEYHNVNRTYSDVAQTLSHYPNFTLRTSVYTYENGRSALLLNLQGTLPVSFRGATYAFPISLWVPQEYPIAGPMGFVVPTKNMVVRPGQYVAWEGRIYHPYLAEWRDDRSNLSEFCSILQSIFSRDPPVVAKQEPSQTQESSNQRQRVPLSVPPLPPKPGSEQNVRPPQSPAGQQPPPPPPKELDGSGRNQRNGDRPPPPPHPTRPGPQYGSLHSNNENGNARHPEPLSQQALRGSSPRWNMDQRSRDPSSQLHHTEHAQFSQGPVSPLNPEPDDGRQYPYPPSTLDAGPHYHVQQAPVSQHLEHPARGDRTSIYRDGNQQPVSYPVPQVPPTQSHRQQIYHQEAPRPPKAKPPEDLLTSPFETTLPAQPTNIAPPPIPPNPQKDALLSALSQTLTQQVQATHNSNLSALPPLRAQQAAITTTLNAINAEMSQLNDLEALLTSNETILHKAMQDADKVLEDAKQRTVPNVDDVLVAPTVVAGQLYQLVAEESAIEESRSVLGKALDKGRIGSGLWAKQTRSLAREEFLKKALIKKISRGIGLVDRDDWG